MSIYYFRNKYRATYLRWFEKFSLRGFYIPINIRYRICSVFVFDDFIFLSRISDSDSEFRTFPSPFHSLSWMPLKLVTWQANPLWHCLDQWTFYSGTYFRQIFIPITQEKFSENICYILESSFYFIFPFVYTRGEHSPAPIPVYISLCMKLCMYATS